MIAGLRAWLHGLRHLNEQGYIYIWANLCWALLTLPVVTAPAAWAGLVRMSCAAHTSPSASINDFWIGFRENLGRGILLGLLNVVLVTINISNIQAYRHNSEPLLVILRMVWLLTLVLWFAVQFYVWPVFYQMERSTMTNAFRNAAVMVLLNPGFTFGLWLGVMLIIVLSMILVPAWLLITGGALASIATGAVFDRLAAAGYPIEQNIE